MNSPDALLDLRSLSKLKWRCRRGLLENDLLIARFFQQHESTLTRHQADGLSALMELADNDLLDLLLQRRMAADLTDPEARAWALKPEAMDVLPLMHAAAAVSAQPPYCTVTTP